MVDSGAAFFRFDTNAEDVARRIGAAMTAIQREMLKATERSGGLQGNTGVAGMQRDLVGLNDQVRQLTRSLADGALAPAKYVAEFQKLAKSGLQTMQQEQLTQLLRSPQGFLQSMDFGALGRTTGRAYGDFFLKEAEATVAALPGKFKHQKNFIEDLKTSLGQVTSQPFPLSLPPNASRMDAARLAALKESVTTSYARENIDTRTLNRMFPGLAAEMQSGELQQVYETKGKYRPATERLQALQREAREAEAIAYRQVREEQQAAARSERLRQREGADDARRIQAIERQDRAKMSALHREAIEQNKIFDDRNKAHAAAIREDERRTARQLRDAQAVANFENATRNQQRKILDQAYAENERRDRSRMAQAQAVANFENKTREDQRKILDAAYKQNEKIDQSRRSAAHDEALQINARREYLRLLNQGTIFGNSGYGRVGQDLYSVGSGGASRIGAAGDPLANRQQIVQALAAEQRHMAQITREAERQAALDVRRHGTVGEVFSSGFLGRGFNVSGGGAPPTFAEGLRNELATLGTVARYSGVYAVLSGITAAISDTKAEALDFTDSLTDLKVALDAPAVDSGLVTQLQQIAVLSGSNTGAALDAAARGIRAFGDDAVESGGNIESAGTDIAEASTKIALIASKDLRDATGDVIAIASAFNLTAAQANQVVDAVSAAKDFGGDPTNIAQGLANFATTANEAGFTLGEAANALSLVIARTDQSGQAAATRLSRITSILAGTTGRRVIDELNAAGLRDAEGEQIDPTQSVKEQLRQIAEAYQTAAPEVQGKIRSALGGTTNLRELIPLLEPGVFDRIIEEGANQSGRGAEEFRRKTTDLVGLFKKLQGEISAVQVNLFQSGAFDGIGVVLKGLEPALNVLNRLLNLFNQFTEKIPGLQLLIGVVLDLKLALLGLKALGAIQSSSVLNLVAPALPARGIGAATAAGITSGAAATVGGTSGAAAAATTASTAAATRSAAAMTAAAVAAAEFAVTTKAAALAAAEAGLAMGVATAADVAEADASLLAAQADLAEARASATAAAASAAAGGSRGAGLLATLGRTGPLAALAATIGGLYTVFKAIDKSGEIERTQRRNAQAVQSTDFGDAGAIRSLADTIRANRAELRESQKGTISGLLVKADRDRTIEQAASQEKYFRALAKRVAAEDKTAIALEKTSLFGIDAAASTESVASAMAKLNEAGTDAVITFNALSDAIQKRPGPTGNVPLPTDTPTQFITGLIGDLFDTVPEAGKKLDFTGRATSLGGRYGKTTFEELTPRQVANRLTEMFPDLEKAGTAKLKSFGLKDGVAPTEAQMNELVQTLIEGANLDRFGPDAQKLAQGLQTRLVSKLKNDFDTAQANPYQTGLDPKTALDQIVGTDKIAGLMPGYDAAVSALPKSDFGGRQALGDKLLRDMRVLLARAELFRDGDPNALAALQRQYQLAQEKVSQAVFEDSRQLREAAQMRAKTKGEVARIGREFFNTDYQAALDANNLDLLIQIFDLASQVEIAAAQAAAEAAAQAAAAYVDYLGNGGGGGSIRAIEHAQQKAQEAAADVDLIAEAKRRSVAPRKLKNSSYHTGPSGSAGSGGEKDDLTAAQLAALRRQAQIAPDDRIAQAKADIQSARADLRAAEKGSAEYYQALNQLNDAKFALAQAAAGRKGAAAGARAARQGGQVAPARAALVEAAANLGTTTKGTEAYYNALAQYVEAQRAYADALAASRFTRRRAQSDVTNPVQQARIDLAEARAKLARDRRSGAGREVLDEDRIDVKNKQAAAEQAAFQRRLNDAQVAEQLGKMSHAQYIKYLQNEHDRLSSIKNKTRQQVEQLQQIDLAMKAATETMQGQFNLGNIKVPTPYEARRALQAQRQGTNFIGQSQTTVNNFRIDGTDIIAVKKVITDVLGPLATQRSSNGSRKV